MRECGFAPGNCPPGAGMSKMETRENRGLDPAVIVSQTASVKQPANAKRTALFLTLAALILAIVVSRVDLGGHRAGGPLGMPKDGKPDHRFQFLSAWERARIPAAAEFDPPMGTERGGLVYNAQKFWDMNEKRGGHHTGDDLNGIGGMNTDLGDPVYATADGLVLYTGEPSPGWGNVIVVAHRMPDGSVMQSMYAHLDRIGVKLGSLVSRGQKIGSVGTANGYYPAHLHFEMRASDQVDIGGGYASDPLNHLDPMATVMANHHAAPDQVGPSPLSLLIAAGRQ